MATREVSLIELVCERCTHSWIPRHESSEPKYCPKCKSPYWNKPRRASLGGAL